MSIGDSLGVYQNDIPFYCNYFTLICKKLAKMKKIILFIVIILTLWALQIFKPVKSTEYSDIQKDLIQIKNDLTWIKNYLANN